MSFTQQLEGTKSEWASRLWSKAHTCCHLHLPAWVSAYSSSSSPSSTPLTYDSRLTLGHCQCLADSFAVIWQSVLSVTPSASGREKCVKQGFVWGWQWGEGRRSEEGATQQEGQRRLVMTGGESAVNSPGMTQQQVTTGSGTQPR